MTTTALPPDTPKPEEQLQQHKPEEVSRRKFLFKLSIAANSIVGAFFAVPILGYLLGPVMKKEKAAEFWVGLGPLDQFPEGETRLASFRNPSTSPSDGQTADLPCWVRRIAGNQFQVFAINCAHLGCPVRWFSQSKLFMCPCHGGAYYQDGSRASGPPERGLFEYEYKIESNNLIVKVGDLPTLARPGTKQVADCPGATKPAADAPLVQIGEAQSTGRGQQGRSQSMASLKQGAIGVYNWLEHRLGLFKPTMEAAAHPIPIKSESWLYVFGSAATILLGLQVVTGILLALVYTPSANEAWKTLHFLNNDIPLGWFLRAIHGWGSNFMVAIVLIHMCQVFLFGAYKFPRELTWIIGVFLLLLTLGMAFTGQVLRFDQDAYWGLGIGASITSRIPLIGGPAVSLLLGGPIIGGATLSRFFALHVFVIPGILLAGVGVHVWMVLHLGINDWPMPGRIVRKATYEREYHQQTAKEGIPFVPDGAWKDGCFAAVIILAVIACALFFGPIGPSGQPDPRIIETAPKPDFFFLWIYAVLAYLPPSIETPVMFIVPTLVIGGMLLLPLVFGEGEKHWSRRPVAVLTLAVVAVSLGVFTRLGTYTPWSPIMDAWTADSIPARYLHDRTPLEREGAIVFQNKQCRNCHSIGGAGGLRGPALDAVAARMTYDQLVRQVVQGGGNMPAYGNALDANETTALVGFLSTLRGHDLNPAVDASQKLTHTSQLGTPPAPAHSSSGSTE